MKTKAIFLDVDGTLISFKTHEIPQITIDALNFDSNVLSISVPIIYRTLVKSEVKTILSNFCNF